jgi:hypothetical protein
MRTTLSLSAAAMALGLVGCAATASPDWDARFGDSLRILQAGQLIEPDAPARHGQTLPPSDGRTVSESMHRHVDSYRRPPPSEALSTGAGGTAGGR